MRDVTGGIHVKNTTALVAILAALTTIAACRSKDSPGQTPATREDRRPSANAQTTAKNSQRGDKGAPSTDRPHESDSDLLQAMK